MKDGVRGFFTNPSRADDCFIPFTDFSNITDYDFNFMRGTTGTKTFTAEKNCTVIALSISTTAASGNVNASIETNGITLFEKEQNKTASDNTSVKMHFVFKIVKLSVGQTLSTYTNSNSYPTALSWIAVL